MRPNSLTFALSGFILLFFLALFGQAPVLISPSHPVEIDEIDYNELARKYGITFPIPELGNCANFAACLTYCADPVNYRVCLDYGKSKDFYEEEDIEVRNKAFWQTAKRELGCDSYAACQAFCELPQNYSQCDKFASRHNLNGGYLDDPAGEKILGIAREFLGCDSYESCRTFCENPTNYERCAELAQEIGIRGGEYRVGPGGCTSEETCSHFCSDPNNYEVCSQYARSTQTSFVGPGGCNSEPSCRAYCSQNPDECRYFGEESIDPESFCRKFPDKCAQVGVGTDPSRFEKYCLEKPEACTGKWVGRAEVYKDFCSANPDKCEIGPGGYPIPKDSSYWQESADDFCQKYPEKCEIYKGGFDPAKECAKYSGCSWTGETCQCGDYPTPPAGGYPLPVGTGFEDYCRQYPERCEEKYQGGYDPASECAKQAGCSWTGSYCQCQGAYTPAPTYAPVGGPGSYDPATECGKQPGCSWTGSYCQCGGETGGAYSPPPESGSSPPPDSGQYSPPPEGVYGAAAGRGLLQLIWQFLSSLLGI